MDPESEQHRVLQADEKRQAIPALGGFEYQMWHSVYQWIMLKPDESLFLEGAEDFDVISSGEAETVQVKNTAASLTLNSNSALDAITHFWRHQANNPKHLVRFRFLTTSGRGRERDSPFGEVRGLDLWDRCKNAGADLEDLRVFLSRKELLPSDLREFVSKAADDELREKLIRRITWQTAQGDHAEIREVIRRKVISVGAQLFVVTPSESERLVPHLFTRVFEVVRDKTTRGLEFADFIELFEAHVTIRVSRAELQLRSAAAVGLATPTGVASGDVNLVAEDPRAFALPSFELLSKRVGVVDDLVRRLKRNGVLVIGGSSGTGKSTLAVLLAEREGDWRRLDFRNLEPERVSERFVRATLNDAESSLQVDYVIDDLNFDSHASNYERNMAAFIYQVSSRGGRIVVTTQSQLPNRIDLAFNLPPEAHFMAPWLTEDEVKEIAIAHSCPDGKKGDSWSKIVHVNTLGHPLLVHAKIKKLSALGWPAPKIEDIIDQQDVENVRREVRNRLAADLPSEQARTLAYRLDTFSLFFRREHALFIGGHPPALANRGEAFDVLVGPWVEQVNDKYYRLSPLLRGSAAEMFGQEEVKNLHKTAAYGFLEDRKSISQFELNGVLFHGLIGEIAPPLDVIARNIDKIKHEEWPLVAAEIDWISFMALNEERLFKTNPFTSLMLRNLQFRVAASTSPADRAPRVVSAWERELDAFDEFNENPAFLITRMAFQYFFNAIFFRIEVPIPISTIVRNVVKSATLLKACKESAAAGDEIVRKALEMSPHGFDVFDDYVFIAAVRCKSANDVAEFLEALRLRDDELGIQQIWDELRTNDYVAMLLVSGVWLPEIKAVEPNWPRCFEVLDKAIEAGLDHQADSLVANAYRAKAIVVREYAPTGEDPEAILLEANRKIGCDHPIVLDYMAKLYMLNGRYTEALKVWKNIPREEDVEESTARVFTEREAVISAAKIGEWEMAANYALAGEEHAPRLSHLGDAIATRFTAERAFALWQTGDLRGALESFWRVIEALPLLPDPNANIKSYAFHLRILFILKWIGDNLNEEEKKIQPEAGWFTDSVTEVAREKPAPSYLFYWYFLADAEYKANVEAGIFARLDVEQQKANVPLANSLADLLRIKRSLRDCATGSLIDHYAKFAASAREVRETANMPELPNFDMEMLNSLAFAALVILASRKRQNDFPVEEWIAGAQRFNFVTSTDITAYLEFLKRARELDEHELTKFVNDLTTPGFIRLGAAVFLVSSSSLDPAVRFSTNVLLLTNEQSYLFWRKEIESSLEKLIIDGWEATVKEQRFALLSPRTTVPEILRTCTDRSVTGLRKVARVLIAVQKAVSVRLPEDVTSRLSALAR